MRVIFLCLLCGLFPLKAMADDLVVFAAASLKGPLDAIIADFDDVVVSYAGSGTLARQVSAGAPADVVLLANAEWTDVLEAEGHIIDPVEVTGNRLVLIGRPEMDAVPLTIEGLTVALDGGRLAMGFTQSVPAGIYGQAALEGLGVWDAINPMIVETQSVRAALALVARGEAPLGVVYQSDALIAPDLPIVARFPVTSHPRIAYFAAVSAASTHPGAAAFVANLRNPNARAILDEAGFCTDQRWC
jgi:molybdate transport system substrate-binding protein